MVINIRSLHHKSSTVAETSGVEGLISFYRSHKYQYDCHGVHKALAKLRHDCLHQNTKQTCIQAYGHL